MSRKAVGISLIMAGAMLPLLVWFGGNAFLSSTQPPPNQSGMVIVFLGFWASVGMGSILGIAGLIMLLRRSPSS